MNYNVNIAIEGNIGAGKSTLIERLTKHYEADAKDEAVKDWTDLGGNVLGKYYENPKKFAFMFQVLVMTSFQKRCGLRDMFQGRSLYSAYYVFSAINRVRGHIDHIQMDVLEKLFERFLEANDPLNGIIYIRVPTEDLMNRIKKRDRPEETNIACDYIHDLNKWYKNVFRNNKHYLNVEVCEIDGTLPEDEVFNKACKFIDRKKERSAERWRKPMLRWYDAYERQDEPEWGANEEKEQFEYEDAYETYESEEEDFRTICKCHETSSEKEAKKEGQS